MKYSLRSLMIVVTLVAVLLGGRIEYLRRMAAFHEHEQARHLAEWRDDFELRTSPWDASLNEAHDRVMYFHHKSLASKYREATYRPWTVVRVDP